MGFLDMLKKPEPEVAKEVFKILVVDDDEPLREFYKDLLSKNGYAVTTATNGQEALAAVSSDKPHVILLDIMMPIMDGIEALRQLNTNEQTNTIPVIVLTNAGDLDNMDKAKFYSAYKFFVKANTAPEVLLKTVGEAIVAGRYSVKEIPLGEADVKQ